MLLFAIMEEAPCLFWSQRPSPVPRDYSLMEFSVSVYALTHTPTVFTPLLAYPSIQVIVTPLVSNKLTPIFSKDLFKVTTFPCIY